MNQKAGKQLEIRETFYKFYIFHIIETSTAIKKKGWEIPYGMISDTLLSESQGAEHWIQYASFVKQRGKLYIYLLQYTWNKFGKNDKRLLAKDNTGIKEKIRRGNNTVFTGHFLIPVQSFPRCSSHSFFQLPFSLFRHLLKTHGS